MKRWNMPYSWRFSQNWAKLAFKYGNHHQQLFKFWLLEIQVYSWSSLDIIFGLTHIKCIFRQLGTKFLENGKLMSCLLMAICYLMNIIVLLLRANVSFNTASDVTTLTKQLQGNSKIFVSFYTRYARYVIFKTLEKAWSRIVLSFQLINAGSNFWCFLSKKLTWADKSHKYELILYLMGQIQFNNCNTVIKYCMF